MKNFDVTYFLFLSALAVVTYVPLRYLNSPKKMEKVLEKNIVVTSTLTNEEKQKVFNSTNTVAAFYFYQ